MKKTGFKRMLLTFAPPAPPTKATRTATYEGTTGAAQPKSPADRLQAIKELARGEECTGKMYGGFCRCHPETVVWAHQNTLAANKGMGYKANDSGGAFLGAECHRFIDQPIGTNVPLEQRMAVWHGAVERTTRRLREIAGNRMEREWKRKAAQWALDRRTPSLPDAGTHGEKTQ